MNELGSGHSDLHGAEIAARQRFLAKKSFYSGRITGDYDSQTRDSTKKFQEVFKLVADGIVGPQTVERARRESFAVSTGTPGPRPLH
ncbi:MAG: peptidoglycan-binding domain-containing protein, partial [Candidatus Binataceae bacterium]